MTPSVKPDHRLMDLLKQGFDLANDSQRADFLGINRTTLHHVRHGTAQLRLMQKLKVLDRLAFLKARNLVESIVPERLAQAIRQGSNQLAHRRIEAKSADAELLMMAKTLFRCSHDADLSERLRITPSTISVVRGGRSSIGPKPRIRILYRFLELEYQALLESGLTEAEAILRREELAQLRRLESGLDSTELFINQMEAFIVQRFSQSAAP